MPKLLDITAVEAEAKAELAKEQAGSAKTKIKASLSKIAAAEAVLANLRRDHEVLLREIGSE